LTVAGFLAGSAGASGKTAVIHWSPFDADGSLRAGVGASPAFGGDCYTGSFAVHGAYRCSAGNRLRDPCFTDPNRDDAVLCIASPFSHVGTRLRVTGALNNDGSAHRSVVWAVRLATGQRCTLFAGGATNADAEGRRLNYGCSGRATWLWGNPIRNGGTWHIRSSHSFDPGQERLAAIATAYIGAG
jgi:hypothetical protein